MNAVYRNYRSGLGFRESSVNWSRDQKTEWTLRQLRKCVRKAATETEFYRERFKSIGFDPLADFSFEDFAELPILSREDIQISGNTLLSNAIPAEERVRNSTGGSTGAPTQIWMGPEERGWSESGAEVALKRIGVPIGSRLAYLWGHHLDPQLKPNLSERLRGWALNYRFFDCFRLSNDVFQSYHEQLERYSPDCIVAYASALGHFAEYLKKRGIKPSNYPRVCFVTGAEKLYPKHRSAIEEVFGPGRPVHERYGGRDFGPVGIQIDPQGRGDISVDWSWCLVEPETSETNSPILITKLHADAMPMIRYRVGDVGRFPASSAPGSPTFDLTEIVGRQTEGIRLQDGSWLHGIQFPHLMKDFPVREFMLVQETDLSMELKIVPADGFRDSDGRKIFDKIRANAGDLPLKIVCVDSIERGPANKWSPVMTKAEN